MIVSLLVAMDRRGGIGRNGALPWRLPADLQRFKQLTWGHTLIMGRKTYDSIGRPLPGRVSLVISRSPVQALESCRSPACRVLGSLPAAVELAAEQGETEAFVIGGAQIFRLALPLAGRIYLTRVEALVEADTFFPAWDESGWQMVEEIPHPADERHEFAFVFQRLERKSTIFYESA